MKFGFLERWASAGAIAACLATGCSPKIGDKCSVSTDRSVQGDRLCDPSQPGGYCTVFNCEPNGCPDESVCVAFNEASCSSPALSRRFQRTFCMATCGSDGDCRAGHKRLDTSTDPLRQVVDVNPSGRSICAVHDTTMQPITPDPAVCFSPDASTVAPDGAAEAATPDAPASEAA